MPAELCDLKGEVVHTFEPGHLDSGHSGRRRPVFTRDGQHILAAQQDDTQPGVGFWSIDGTRLAAVRPTMAKAGKVSNDKLLEFRLSPDEQRFLTVTEAAVQVWDRQGEEVASFRGHTGLIRDADFSPDGRLVASLGEDAVRVWDLDGRVVAVLHGAESAGAVGFSNDERPTRVYAAGYRDFHWWMLSAKSLLEVADQRITRDFTEEEREKYAALLGTHAADR